MLLHPLVIGQFIALGIAVFLVLRQRRRMAHQPA